MVLSCRSLVIRAKIERNLWGFLMVGSKPSLHPSNLGLCKLVLMFLLVKKCARVLSSRTFFCCNSNSNSIKLTVTKIHAQDGLGTNLGLWAKLNRALISFLLQSFRKNRKESLTTCYWNSIFLVHFSSSKPFFFLLFFWHKPLLLVEKKLQLMLFAFTMKLLRL